MRRTTNGFITNPISRGRTKDPHDRNTNLRDSCNKVQSNKYLVRTHSQDKVKDKSNQSKQNDSTRERESMEASKSSNTREEDVNMETPKNNKFLNEISEEELSSTHKTSKIISSTSSKEAL